MYWFEAKSSNSNDNGYDDNWHDDNAGYDYNGHDDKKLNSLFVGKIITISYYTMKILKIIDDICWGKNHQTQMIMSMMITI